MCSLFTDTRREVALASYLTILAGLGFLFNNSEPYVSLIKCVIMTLLNRAIMRIKLYMCIYIWLLRWLSGKECTYQCRRHRDMGLIPGSKRYAGVGMATHSNILAWKILWTERPGRPQSMGHRVGYN